MFDVVEDGNPDVQQRNCGFVNDKNIFCIVSVLPCTNN